MKILEWTDGDGYDRRALAREGDEPGEGIPLDPPDLGRLDWEGVKRDLHNHLVSHGWFSWEDIQKTPGLQAVCASVLKRRVIALYREEPDEQ